MGVGETVHEWSRRALDLREEHSTCEKSTRRPKEEHFCLKRIHGCFTHEALAWLLQGGRVVFESGQRDRDFYHKATLRGTKITKELFFGAWGSLGCVVFDERRSGWQLKQWQRLDPSCAFAPAGL